MIPTSSSAWVRGLLRVFAAQGVERAAVLARAGLAAHRVEDDQERFAADEVTRLWEAALALSGNPALGMDAELAARHIDFQELGMAMLSSADLQGALQQAARYLAVISSATVFELQPDPQGEWIAMGHTGTARPVPVQRSAFSLLAMLCLCRWVVRRPIVPLQVQLACDPPPSDAAYAHAFGGPVRWRAPRHRLLVAAADLAAPVPSHSAVLLPLHERVLDERMQELSEEGILQRVRAAIEAELPRGEPRRHEVARRLDLSDRMLQRRLAAQGTSFQAELDAVRRHLAEQYLCRQKLAPGQAGYLLGFSDESNFIRACKRWFGMAPGALRARGDPEVPPDR